MLVLSLLLTLAGPLGAQTSPHVYVSIQPTGNATQSGLSGLTQASQTGALGLVPGSPFNEKLEGGLLAFDGQGKFLFVLNPTSDDVSMFQIDPISGAPAEVPGSPFAVPPDQQGWTVPNQPLSITGEPSGKFIFVGYAHGTGNTAQASAVASLAIDTSGASPVLIPGQSTTPTHSNGNPIKLLVDSQGRYLYVGQTNGPQGSVSAGADVYSIDSSGMLFYQGQAGNIGTIGEDYAIDPKNRFFYTMFGIAQGLASCAISPVDGTATNCPQIFAFGSQGHSAVVIESSGRFLYVSGAEGTVPTVVIYSIDQTTGVLTSAGSVSGITFSLGRLAADPAGPYIYSSDSNTTNGGIHAYVVDQQTGNLIEIVGSPFSPGAAACCQALTISGVLPVTQGPGAELFPSIASPFTAVAGSSSSTQIFSLVNNGTQSLTINSISLGGPNPSSFSQTNTCAGSIAAAANCSISVNFIPLTAGTFNATLQVSDNTTDSPQTLSLSGAAAAPAPGVMLSPATPSFPTTTEGTSSAPQTLTVTNTGNAPLHVSSVSLGGPNPNDFALTNNCTAAVAPSANCTVLITFNPIAPGQRTATLTLADDASPSSQAVSLSATASVAVTAGATAGGSTSASVSAGQTAQYQLQLAPGAGYTGTISLTCSGAPTGALCQVPASLSVTGTASVPFTVSVSTSGSAFLPVSRGTRPWPVLRIPLWPLIALVFLLLTAPRLRAFLTTSEEKSGALSAACVLILCVIFGASGCGGSAATTPQVITPPGNYTITIVLSAKSATGQALQLQPVQLILAVK